MITSVVLGVFDCVWEELVFCICLLRGATLRKKCTYVICLQLCHFDYINNIHVSVNDVTKGG